MDPGSKQILLRRQQVTKDCDPRSPVIEQVEEGSSVITQAVEGNRIKIQAPTVGWIDIFDPEEDDPLIRPEQELGQVWLRARAPSGTNRRTGVSNALMNHLKLSSGITLLSLVFMSISISLPYWVVVSVENASENGYTEFNHRWGLFSVATSPEMTGERAVFPWRMMNGEILALILWKINYGRVDSLVFLASP